MIPRKSSMFAKQLLDKMTIELSRAHRHRCAVLRRRKRTPRTHAMSSWTPVAEASVCYFVEVDVSPNHLEFLASPSIDACREKACPHATRSSRDAQFSVEPPNRASTKACQNRNAARANRNRIFLGISARIFVARTRICSVLSTRSAANQLICEQRITESQMPSLRFSASLTT